MALNEPTCEPSGLAGGRGPSRWAHVNRRAGRACPVVCPTATPSRPGGPLSGGPSQPAGPSEGRTGRRASRRSTDGRMGTPTGEPGPGWRSDRTRMGRADRATSFAKQARVWPAVGSRSDGQDAWGSAPHSVSRTQPDGIALMGARRPGGFLRWAGAPLPLGRRYPRRLRGHPGLGHPPLRTGRPKSSAMPGPTCSGPPLVITDADHNLLSSAVYRVMSTWPQHQGAGTRSAANARPSP